MSIPAKVYEPLPPLCNSSEETPPPYDVTRLDRPAGRPRRANNAIEDAFDLIGGVPRLAIWADKNPGEFYTKLWARTIQSSQQQEHSGEIVIRSAVPRTAIDGEFKDVTDVE